MVAATGAATTLLGSGGALGAWLTHRRQMSAQHSEVKASRVTELETRLDRQGADLRQYATELGEVRGHLETCTALKAEILEKLSLERHSRDEERRRDRELCDQRIKYEVSQAERRLEEKLAGVRRSLSPLATPAAGATPRS